jgi:two-component system chemotaxis response regulator CheY
VNVLIIDDEREIRELLAEMLFMNKFTVFQAENGRQGLAVLEKETVDVVISDVQMPIMNGMDFLKALR